MGLPKDVPWRIPPEDTPWKRVTVTDIVTVIVACPQAMDKVGPLPSGKLGFWKMRLVRR